MYDIEKYHVGRLTKRICIKQALPVCILLVRLACGGSAYATLAGKIVDVSGTPVPGTRVFVEPGLGAPVAEGVIATDGTYTIAGDFYGNTGLFALAPGYGYTGVHLNIAPGDRTSGLDMILAPAATVSGQVKDERGNPVNNARITALAITDPVKVGIPLFKLIDFGVNIPASDGEGRFTLPGVPEGAQLVLKIEHPQYAQEAVADVGSGESDLEVTLYHGVSLRGQVTIRNTGASVSGALVTVRNAQPPHDTAFGTTDGTGVFKTLLKPGVYLVQAHAEGRISDGWQRVEVRGDTPEVQVRLALSEKGIITGSIQNARSGAPVPGARVMLETRGRAAGATRTGADGRFRLEAPEGVNTLHFEAVNGFLPPDTKALNVTVAAGEEHALPGLWLAPAPE